MNELSKLDPVQYYRGKTWLDVLVPLLKTNTRVGYLRSHFDSSDLATLSLVIAQEIFPKKTWEIVGAGEEAIVTDAERSMVFDFQHCYELSGLGVLALCGDAEANRNPKAVAEAASFQKRRIEELQTQIALAQRDLAKHTNAENLIDFPRK